MTTIIKALDSSIQKTNEILNKIEAELGWHERDQQTYSAVRIVLHALRDRLTVVDASNFSAQLPILLKGVFYDSYKPENMPDKMSKTEFSDRIREEFPLSMEGTINDLVRTVIKNIFTNEEEKVKLKSLFPSEFHDLFE